MNPFEVKYVQLNEDGLRDRLRAESKRLERMAQSEHDAGFTELAFVTYGRVSGIHFALSFLDEFVVRENERDV